MDGGDFKFMNIYEHSCGLIDYENYGGFHSPFSRWYLEGSYVELGVTNKKNLHNEWFGVTPRGLDQQIAVL